MTDIIKDSESHQASKSGHFLMAQPGGPIRGLYHTIGLKKKTFEYFLEVIEIS